MLSQPPSSPTLPHKRYGIRIFIQHVPHRSILHSLSNLLRALCNRILDENIPHGRHGRHSTSPPALQIIHIPQRIDLISTGFGIHLVDQMSLILGGPLGAVRPAAARPTASLRVAVAAGLGAERDE